MSQFKDYFSQHARQYASARPNYPAALIEFLADQAPGRALAWDVATGNGQAAAGLARYFERVHASDASSDQIAVATPVAGVHFSCEPAEQCSLADDSADLVTVAQAAHWFNLDRFYREARRVTRAGGVLAIWCYGQHRVDSSIDPLVAAYYQSLGDYWPPERRHIETGYDTLPFPFDPLPTPQFEMQVHWSLDGFLGYLRSWSATQRFLRDRGSDPVQELAGSLVPVWGDGTRAVTWPLSLKLARLS